MSRSLKKLERKAARIGDGFDKYFDLVYYHPDEEDERYLDNVYRLDHAVTANQKAILEAFKINVPYIKDRAKRITDELSKGTR